MGEQQSSTATAEQAQIGWAGLDWLDGGLWVVEDRGTPGRRRHAAGACSGTQMGRPEHLRRPLLQLRALPPVSRQSPVRLVRLRACRSLRRTSPALPALRTVRTKRATRGRYTRRARVVHLPGHAQKDSQWPAARTAQGPSSPAAFTSTRRCCLVPAKQPLTDN